MWGQTETGSLSPWRSEPTRHTDVCRNSDMLGLFPSTGSSAFWEVFVLIPRSLSSTRAILVLILCGMAFIYVFIFFLKRFFLVCVLVFCLCVSVRTTSWILWNLESQMVMSHHVGTSCSARAVIALSHWPISLGLVFHSFVYFYIITWIGLSVERDLFSYLAAIELATVTLSPPPPRDTTPFMCAHARGNFILPLGMRHVEALWKLGAWAVPLTVPVAHLGAGLRLLHWPWDGPASWPYVHSVHDY